MLSIPIYSERGERYTSNDHIYYIFRCNLKEAPSGLFNYVVPTDQVMAKALSLCREICGTSPMSSMLNRHMIVRNRNMSPEEAHLVESKAIYWVARQGDAKEGIQSFLEKRPPASDPPYDSSL